MFYIIFLFVWVPIAAVISAFVFTVLWGWFMVPIFHLPQLSIVQAIGVGLVATWFTVTNYDSVKDQDFGELISRLVAKWAVYLGVGYIAHLLM